MKIFLRILILFLLILSGVALFFGWKLFDQREQLKARVDLLENYVRDLSREIESEKALNPETRNRTTVNVLKEDLKKYYVLDPATGKPLKQPDPQTAKMVRISDGPDTMKAHLRNVLEKAQEQTKMIDSTRVTLKDTRLKLEDTQATLRGTKKDLAAAREEIEGLKDNVADLRDEVTDNLVTIDNKDEQIAELEGQLRDADEKIAQLEDRIFELNTHITAQDKHITELQNEIDRLKEADKGEWRPITRGPKGKVLSVNPSYNFIVASIVPESKLAKDIELLIQRDKKFVGKVRVTSINEEDHTVIAVILREWLQMPIQKGDYVVY